MRSLLGGRAALVLGASLALSGAAAPSLAAEATSIHRVSARLGDAADAEERGWIILEVEAALPSGREEELYFEVSEGKTGAYAVASGDFIAEGAEGRKVGVTYWMPEPEDCGKVFQGKVKILEAFGDEDATATTGLSEGEFSLDITDAFCATVPRDEDEVEDFE